jgi:uncharacterized protein (DUF305 family)
MIVRNASLLIVVAAVSLLGAACDDGSSGSEDDSSPRIVQPGAPGEPARELTQEDLEDFQPPAYTDADVRFMQSMIPHHAQALEMTDLVESRAAREDIELLAGRIEASQEGEIELMRNWLEARGEQIPAAHSNHRPDGELMPGMLTDEQFDRLAAATGSEFAELFLRLMIRHHEGALTMVQELRADGGGIEPETYTFSAHVEADQQIEIDRMRDLQEEFRDTG